MGDRVRVDEIQGDPGLIDLDEAGARTFTLDAGISDHIQKYFKQRLADASSGTDNFEGLLCLYSRVDGSEVKQIGVDIYTPETEAKTGEYPGVAVWEEKPGDQKKFFPYERLAKNQLTGRVQRGLDEPFTPQPEGRTIRLFVRCLKDSWCAPPFYCKERE